MVGGYRLNKTGISRRKLLQRCAAGALGYIAPVPSQSSDMSRRFETSQSDPLLALTLSESARRLRAGELSAQELADAVIAAAARYAELNAYTTFAAQKLHASAVAADVRMRRSEKIGSLHGVPLILKDNINTRDLPTSGGTPALKNNRPNANAPVAAHLFAQGALLAGKANMHELSSGGTSNNHVFGAVGNPYALDRVPGGSSGGTAAAVAAHLVPGGLGTDTAGSVRVPAALCGVVGLRPTTGRYPAAGIVPLSRTLDTAGPIARCVEDVALLDSAITGAEDELEYETPAPMRLGVPVDSLLAAASASVLEVVEKALGTLEKAGVTVVDVDLAAIRKLTYKASGALIGSEFDEVMRGYLEEFAPGMTVADVVEQIASPAARKLYKGETRRPVSKTLIREVHDIHLPALKRSYVELFENYELDALIYPTTPEIALPRAEDDSVYRDGKSVFSWFYFSNTSLASMAGNPSLTLPAGLSKEGMPVGISVDGLPGTDRRVLGTGRAMQMLLAVG